MNMSLLRGAVFALLAGAATLASAQAYPSKPIRVIVPFGAGSGTDILTRTITEDMAKTLNTTFVVENKPGASAQIAAEATAKADPDGYTIMMTTNTAHSSTPHLYKKLRYDPLKDFTPIARVIIFGFALAVKGDSPYKTPQDLVAHLKANPGKYSYGHGNSTGQIAGAHFVKVAGLDVASVPYKTTPPAMTDLAAGQIEFMFVDLAASKTFVNSGKLRLIGMQSDKRSSLAPELPPVGDVTPGLTFDAWGGFIGPAGLSPQIVQTLNAAANKAMANPAVREKMLASGLEPIPATVEEFRKFAIEQHAVWGNAIRNAGIQPE